MNGLLQGRIALITGASSGIGRAVAQAFAREGAAGIVLADTSENPREGGTATAELIGGRARFVRTDVTAARDVEAAVRVAEELGGIDVLVCAAGVFARRPIEELDESEICRQLDVSVTGTLLTCRAAMPAMRDGGSIVTFSSTAGLLGGAGFSAYGAAKGAVLALSRALAAELGHRGTRVNTVVPGTIRTAMTTQDWVLPDAAARDRLDRIPLRRVGEPTEVADAVVFLASRMAAYVTGAALVVDGGRTSAL